ncbi:molybdopterin-binding protein, partial [Lacrimispora sp.]|uniref:molybdopterin-binding protein n=1 Tax=Lacrimispora sp. TaxID=2719234 RepID=UPI00289DA212
MKEIKTVDAVGQVLCHDMTQIIPGVLKDARFRKGHVVTEEDIPVLLSMGKEHLYVWEKDDSLYHENEAAEILCSLCFNDNMERSEVKEGQIELKSTVRGLLKIDTGLLDKINSMGNMMIASRHPNTPVEPGDKLCGTRIIPLVIEKEKMEEVKEVCGGKKIFAVMPYLDKKVGIVTTGSEVFHGRVKDAFGPVLKAKVEELNGQILGQTVTDDNPEHTTEAILDL